MIKYLSRIVTYKVKYSILGMATIKQSLEKIKDSKDNSYQILKDLAARIVLNKQDISEFEKYSFMTRTVPSTDVVLNVRESYNLLKQYETSNRALLGKMNTGTSQQPQEPTSLTFQPNLMQESRIFAKFGIGFGEDESYRIFRSLALLSVKKSTKQLKLWGKVMCKKCDYYIAEGLADGAQEGELPPGVQPKGTGINKFNYWVTNTLTGQWTELPTITPQQLKISRKLKYIFTGDISAPVLTNPLFPGKQSHLLKCQIVRISATCTIIPKGLFVVSPEDPKQIVPPEEPQPLPEVEDLCEAVNWVYSNPNILRNGRISHLKPEGLQGEDEQKWVKEQNQKDPFEPRLKTIGNDMKNWSIREIKGLKNQMVGHPKNIKPTSTSVVSVKNLIWQGWTTVAYGNGKWSSIYVGYGWKSKQCYYPCEPESILCECEDKEEVVIEQ